LIDGRGLVTTARLGPVIIEIRRGVHADMRRPAATRRDVPGQLLRIQHRLDAS